MAEKQLKLNPSVENLQIRMERMESNIGQLVTAVQSLLQPKADVHTEAQGAVPPQKDIPSARIGCPDCTKDFKNKVGLNLHRGKEHKKVA